MIFKKVCLNTRDVQICTTMQIYRGSGLIWFSGSWRVQWYQFYEFWSSQRLAHLRQRYRVFPTFYPIELLHYCHSKGIQACLRSLKCYGSWYYYAVYDAVWSDVWLKEGGWVGLYTVLHCNMSILCSNPVQAKKTWSAYSRQIWFNWG